MKLITGMHRSGSSILSKILIEAGADFGDESSMYPADEWNPDGYFEQHDILDVNLQLVNGKLGKLSYAFLPSEQKILDRAKPIQPELEAAIAKYGKLSVKENRFCLTLHAWMAQGLEVEKVIVCIRNPEKVVKSLWNRNRLPPWFGYRIWLTHYERLIDTLQKHDIPFMMASHEALTDLDGQASEHFAKLADFFEVGKGAKEINDILANNLRKKAPSQPPKNLPLPVSRMYESLMRQNL